MTTAHRGRDEALVDLAALSSYLASFTVLRRELPVRAIERIGRGQSNLTFRVSLVESTVILRRPPPGPLPPKAHDVLREFRVMRALRNSAVPVPEPIHACEDPKIIGAPFFLMQDLPGDAIRFTLPLSVTSTPNGARLISERVVDALAALHSTDPAAAGLADLSKPSGYVERQLRLWRGQLDYARTRAVLDLDWTSEWLEQNRPSDVTRPSIVHGDYKLDNLIFTTEPPPRLLGVVDWEMAALGDPLTDLGWLLAFWSEDGTPPAELSILPRITEQSGFLRRAELIRRYGEQGGRDLPDLTFYVVMALWKMAILLEAHWARHIRGTAGAFDFGYLEDGGPIFWRYIREMAGG